MINKQINLKRSFFNSNCISENRENYFNIQSKLVKQGKIIYSLRTVFIILPESLKEIKNTYLTLYYPINNKIINNKYNIPQPSFNDILINNLEELCYQVCIKLNLDIDKHSYKLNIFNQHLNLITSDEQLIKPNIKNNILYVKISNSDLEEERKNIDRCDNHNDPKSKSISSNIFKDINKDFFNNKELQSKFNSYEMFSSKKNITTNFLTEQSILETEKENEISSNNTKQRNLKKFSFYSNSKDESEYKIDYDLSGIFQSSKYTNLNKLSPKFPKINNKVKISIEDKDIIAPPRNKLEVKKLKLMDDLKSPLGIINIEEENTILNEDEDFIEDNQTLFYDINQNINNFVINKTNKFITDSEAGYFIFLKLNYILFNEMSDFPIIQLKKQFLFLAFLSNVFEQTQIQFCKDFYNFCKNEKNETFSFVLKIKNFKETMSEFFKEFIMFSNNKFQFINLMNSSDESISISYLFTILFIFFHKDLSFNIDKELVFLILKSIKIPFEGSLNFKSYCDYLIYLTNNKYTTFEKKFLFLKEMINNLIVHPRKNILLNKLLNTFLIKKKDLRVIIDHNLISLNHQKNENLIKIVEKIYSKIIKYYS